MGIYVLSSSSHSAVPPIRASLKDTREFTTVLWWTFGCIVGFYLLLAAFGYYYFGDAVAEVLTDSFALSRLGKLYLFHPVLSFSNMIAACLGAQSFIIALVSIMA